MERTSMGTSITRRAKWQYPPAQPTPRILHLPRRPRRKAPKPSPSKQPTWQKDRKGVLERLFDQERSFASGAVPVMLLTPRESEEERRRGRVEEEEKRANTHNSVVFVEEEKWRFQAEMLRAECNLLRMERKIAIKKMERRRVHMERTLKSALEILLSVASNSMTLRLGIGLQGRKNICEGKDVNLVLLEEQINDLVEKIEKLQKRTGVKELEVKKCSNFDKHVCLLQRQLQKFGFGGLSDEEICVKEIREMAEASLSIKISNEGSGSFASTSNHHNRNVESLRRKMDGLLESMEEEYGFLLSTSDLSSSSSLQQSNKVNSLDHHCV
ncbi:hypothetical protein Godav_015638 [Gossypium davidsonii]|uniref:Uncharacterized protein n=1 Tax=Gossypium davidsonii TaxID=34287 RepID=A0A7J8RQ78_GOSDV|nr:hypothetical protein [Gossypium davidsonii]